MIQFFVPSRLNGLRFQREGFYLCSSKGFCTADCPGGRVKNFTVEELRIQETAPGRHTVSWTHREDLIDILHIIEATTKGEFLLERVFSHLNLVEKAYFGLRFLNRTGESRWLDPLQKVDKQLKGLSPFTLYFGVKFYASDPCRLLEEITRYQFVLQLKQDIVQGRLPLTDDLAAELFALSLQGGLLLHTILTCIREAFQNARL
ncbi:band 4.1-like protein 4A [Nephila pilipes]|uniref:Band 4.1-like protein 4A n=1 Tax=Nephila pilipes TaxID=299642 RepID=A0A8X6UJL1_NEPPI|nr:band 4.1-like protein 4A [Nephila pilipes]